MGKKTNPYNDITAGVTHHIKKIIDGDHQQAALGTIDKNGYPMVTKVVPMCYSDDIYLLLSDLSEHTKNVENNTKVSIYFAEKEQHQTKSNNPRLTLQGTLKKLILKKNNLQFQKLLKNYNKIEPGSKMWAVFTDFNFYIFTEKRKLFVEGFGKAYETTIKDNPQP